MQRASSAKTFDVAIIGGGVVGCATARSLTLAGAKVILIEKGEDILSGASKANSALLHTGFDAPTGSLELSCMREGYAEYLAIRKTMNLPVLETSALVVAWSEEEEAKLGLILEQAHANGVDDVRLIDPAEIRQRAPHLNDRARRAVLVPGEFAIDPWSAPLAYIRQAVMNGAELWRQTEVTGGQFDGSQWQIETTRGPVRAGAVINAAGLFGDRIETLLLGQASFTIKPRRGQFVVFDKASAALLSTIVLPVPTERTKGIVLCPTIFGNLLVGPTAEEVEDRDAGRIEADVLQHLLDKAVEMLPALKDMPVTATYAGLRPASDRKEYRVWSDPARRWITLGGIRSTGLTASLGLAKHALQLYRAFDRTAHDPISAPLVPAMPNLAEHLPRDWQARDHGVITCHCEWVTEREIRAAFKEPVGALGPHGLKRRTRAGMGRCQGFYCQGRVAALAAEEGHDFTSKSRTAVCHD